MKFKSFTPELTQRRHQVHEICRQFSRSPSKGNLTRLKNLFAASGEKVFIEQGFYCDYGDKIYLGDNVYINMNCTFLDGANIIIDDDCLIGPNVQLLTINHATTPEKRLLKESYASNIQLNTNVWIGAGAIILPGVTIGNGAVIAAGSVVTQDVPDAWLYAGNPAKAIRALD